MRVVSRENKGYSIVFLEYLLNPLTAWMTTYDDLSVMKTSTVLNTMVHKLES